LSVASSYCFGTKDETFPWSFPNTTFPRGCLAKNQAAMPAASVSGFYLAHPDAQYFNVGRIGEDQLVDQAQRRGAERSELQRLLAPNL